MISIIVALYNEETRFPVLYPILEGFLEALGEPWELVLVDDGSNDRTREIIRGWAEKDGRIRVVSLARNLGQGAAVKAGMLLSRGDIVLYTDADMAIPLRWFTELIGRVRSGSDLAIASRWMPGAVIKVPQPALRRNLGKLYYWLAHRLVFDGIYDTNCGLKVYRGDAARLIFGFVRSWRWTFNIEHLWVAHRLGYSIAEVPIEWSHERLSKVHVFRDCLFTLWELTALKLRQMMGGYPVIVSKH
ncbi:MAG: glycosyltransferase [candidate division NC10 bacterium]